MTRPHDPNATVSQRPTRARGSSAAPSGAPTSSARITSRTPPSDSAIEEVMFVEEAQRARGFTAVISGACIATASAVPWLGGDPLSQRACLVALIVMAIASLWFRRWAGRMTEFPLYRRVFRAYGWITLLGVLFVVHYCGVFSPVAIVLGFGVSYFGQTVDRAHGLLLTGVLITAYFAMAMLTTLGVLPDNGLVAATHASFGTHIFATAAVTVVLTLMLSMARLSRTAVRQAIARSRDALLVAQQREAQLAEAHHQLDAALRATVGRASRYTGASAGEYRIGLVIGVGAMGEVYAANHEMSGEEAAVKVLQPAAAERDDLVERMRREAELTSRLNDPRLVRVFDAGRLSDGSPYLTMELLRGRDLAARLRDEGKLALSDVAHLAKELGAGLQHAHDAGVIHRDLKPLNIFDAELAHARGWKILDFGISKLRDSEGTLTRDGVLGTPGYMAPEQARGADVDQRCDIFSLGALLYRALTGQRAFPGDNTPQILFDIVYRMPRRPTSLDRHLPADLDAALAIALAKQPEDRFESAQSFTDAFELACRGQLSDALRERASALVRVHPWGTTRGPANQDRG